MTALSVIVPVYQAAEYLDCCVESILAQTFSDLELILVDDGSTDGSAARCDRWAAADSRVRVIHRENGGVSAARNMGLDAARGEYVAFVDSDDWVEPQMYENLLAAAREYDCAVVLCDCRKVSPGGERLYTHPIRPGYYDRAALEQEYFPHLLMMETVEYPATISNCLMIFRRETARRVRYLEGLRHGEDLLFGAELMLGADSFYYRKGYAPYRYRMTPGSASRRFDPDLWEDHRRMLERMEAVFGNRAEFDFSRQVELCRLFCMYQALSHLRRGPVSRRERGRRMKEILEDPKVRQMLRRLKLSGLPISRKQKMITRLCRWAPRVLILYYGGIP